MKCEEQMHIAKWAKAKQEKQEKQEKQAKLTIRNDIKAIFKIIYTSSTLKNAKAKAMVTKASGSLW